MKYKIVRLYTKEIHPRHREVIKTGLTLEQAKKHCNRDNTKKAGVWFDSYTEE